MTVVIAGCGDLGTEAGLRFASLGHRVVGLRRSAGKLPAAIEGRAVDLSKEVPTLPADTDIVVIAMSPDARTAEAYQVAYVETVKNVAAAINNNCAVPPRVLYVSSTAVYSVDNGSWVDETTPAEPSTPTATVLLEAEETLLQLIPKATIFRLSGIYGPGRTREIDRVREGVAGIPSAPEFTNRIHRDDAAAALVHLATMQEWPAPLYVGVDNLPVDRREVVAFLAHSLSVATAEASDSSPQQEGRGKRLRNGRLRGTGFEFSYPTFREGYTAVMDGVGIRHP